jgi:hypothetical protein
MKFFKLAAVAAALAGAALSASAMTAIQDDQLSSVTGQDGVTIAANLNINIGSFQYTNTTDSNASVKFGNISVKGLIAMTVDVISNASFQSDVTNNPALPTGVGAALWTAMSSGANALPGLSSGTDVVRFAFPSIDGATPGVGHAVSPTITVGSVTLGHSAASMGSFAINQMDLQGTSVYMWAH